MDEKTLRKLCNEYTIKLLEFQEVKVKGIDLFKRSDDKQVELDLIEQSIKFLKKQSTNDSICKNIENIVNKIDDKRKELAEEYKKSYQYKNSKKYKQVDQKNLDSLLDKRNTLVLVLNYIYTEDIRSLEELI